jgi:ribose-phosphate pyrophosphokinase
VITLDLHAGQIQGFFSIPVDELSAMSMMVNHFRQRRIENLTVVSPDMGFAKRARNFAEKLGVPLAIVEKRHLHQIQPADEHEPHVEALNVIGEVSGRRVSLSMTKWRWWIADRRCRVAYGTGASSVGCSRASDFGWSSA